MALDGRIEKRLPVCVPVYLVSTGNHFFQEKVVTENVSPTGARVISRRRWRAGEQPKLAPLMGESQLPTRVVYCQGLRDGLFCLGLAFNGYSINWAEHPWRDTP